MAVMVVAMIVRMVVAATAGVINGGFEGFARQGSNGLRMS
jgi:hypothetical protein